MIYPPSFEEIEYLFLPVHESWLVYSATSIRFNEL